MAAPGSKLENLQVSDSDSESFAGFESDDSAAQTGAVTGLYDKDSDEEALERLVLGNAAGFRNSLFNHDEGPEGSEADGADAAGAKTTARADELEHVEDSDLFFIDTAPVAGGAADGLASASASHITALAEEGRAGEVAVWEDSDDEALAISLMGASLLRKLRIAEAEDVVSGAEFCRRLRLHYLRLHPTPAWAQQVDGRRVKRRRRSSASDSSSSGIDAADDDQQQQQQQPLRDFLRDSNRLAGVGTAHDGSLVLRPEIISIQRTREIPDRRHQPVETLSFHPEHPVLLSTSAASVLFLHHVALDAQPPNPLLASVKVTAAGVRNAQFLYPRGDKIVFAGRRRYFHCWDLPSGVVQKITRVLGHHLEHRSLERFRLSPCGRYMAITATHRKGGGSINILSATTMQWMVEARLQSANGIADVAWWSTGDGLTILGRDGLVGEYSLESRRFVGLWHDDGCVAASVIALGGHGGPEDLGEDRWVAIGSNSGITNVYDRHTLLEPARDGHDELPTIRGRPEPRRTLEQLVTPITVLAFSPDCQLLAFGSRDKKDALRLVHLPSCTVYRNWPTQQTPLGRITAVAFGRDSSLLAVGNDTGKIRLWQIRS